MPLADRPPDGNPVPRANTNSPFDVQAESRSEKAVPPGLGIVRQDAPMGFW
ncbi:MAG: hypothetical protein ACUVTW_10405 [Thermogutta sp.]